MISAGTSLLRPIPTLSLCRLITNDAGENRRIFSALNLRKNRNETEENGQKRHFILLVDKTIEPKQTNQVIIIEKTIFMT